MPLQETPLFYQKHSSQLFGQFESWFSLLEKYNKDIGNTKGMEVRVKFLGMVVQMAKRFNEGGAHKNWDGVSRSTEQWIEELNKSIRKFTTYAIQTNRGITDTEFFSIFGSNSSPYIIEKCCHFTQKLQTIAEYAGLPVIDLTQEICDGWGKTQNPVIKIDLENSEKSQYAKTFVSINQSYRGIAQSLQNLQL